MNNSQLSGSPAVVPPSPPVSPTTPIPSLPGPVELFEETLNLYKRRFKTLLGAVLLPILMMFPLLLVMTIILVAGGFFTFAMIGSKQPDFSLPAFGSALAMAVVILVLLGFIGIIIQLWGQVSLLFAIRDSEEGIGVMEAFRRGWHKILSYWWVSFLAGLIAFGGYMLFIVPGVILGVWFSLATYVLVAEDARGMNALLRSREYVRGRWWAVLGRFFVLGLILMIIYGIVALIGGGLSLLDKDSIALNLLSALLNYSVGILLAPLGAIYGFSLYRHLRELRGEVTPSEGSKTGFILIGIAGLIIGILFFIGTFFLVGILIKTIGTTPLAPVVQLQKARDSTRSFDQLEIQSALDRYFAETGFYPASLEELTPKHLGEIPADPATKLPYEYRPKEEGRNYELCLKFEVKGRQCTSSLSRSSVPASPPEEISPSLSPTPRM